MITATRLHAKRAAEGPRPEPPPASVSYAQHQNELRALAQKYEQQAREADAALPEGSIVLSREELEEYSEHVRAVEGELGTVRGDLQELHVAFKETWTNAEKAAHRVIELEASAAEKDREISELQKPKASELVEQADPVEAANKSTKKTR